MKTINWCEKEMNKLSTLYDDTLYSLESLPQPDEFGQIKMSYQKLRKLMEQRRKLTYVTGFFYGVSCATTRKK